MNRKVREIPYGDDLARAGKAKKRSMAAPLHNRLNQKNSVDNGWIVESECAFSIALQRQTAGPLPYGYCAESIVSA